MAFSFKDLITDIVDDVVENIKKITLPISSGNYQLEYDENGNISRILDADGNKVNIIDKAIDAVELIADKTVESWSDIPNLGEGVKNSKFTMGDGSVHTLEFDENGVLKHEVAPNYEAYYLTNDLNECASRVNNRLSKLMNDSVTLIREYTDKNGNTWIDESILGNVISRTQVTE